MYDTNNQSMCHRTLRCPRPQRSQCKSLLARTAPNRSMSGWVYVRELGIFVFPFVVKETKCIAEGSCATVFHENSVPRQHLASIVMWLGQMASFFLQFSISYFKIPFQHFSVKQSTLQYHLLYLLLSQHPPGLLLSAFCLLLLFQTQTSSLCKFKEYKFNSILS